MLSERVRTLLLQALALRTQLSEESGARAGLELQLGVEQTEGARRLLAAAPPAPPAEPTKTRQRIHGRASTAAPGGGRAARARRARLPLKGAQRGSAAPGVSFGACLAPPARSLPRSPPRWKRCRSGCSAWPTAA